MLGHLRVLVSVLGLIGCKFNFDPGLTDAGLPDDAAPDVRVLGQAPAVPPLICKTTRFLIEPAPATVDLAVAAVAEGYAAIWVDSATAAPAQAMLIGPTYNQISARSLPQITDTKIGGIADAGSQLALATSASSGGRPVQTLWTLGRDLSPNPVTDALPGYVTGRDPYPANSGRNRRAFLTAIGDTLEMRNVSDDGRVNLDISAKNTFTDAGPITELACVDGPPDHTHCTWTVALPGSISRCMAADVPVTGLFPATNGGRAMSDDCHDARAATGPISDDAMLVVWRTANNTVEANYAITAGDVARQIASSGAAPRTTFDGERFWIAWLTDRGDLTLTSFDPALDTRGTLAHHSLAGWVPRGPEAFELVHRDNQTNLVVVRADELDVLTICP